METKNEQLTAIEHAERARSQGQTVAEYCRQIGMSPHVLYGARRQMRKKGLLEGLSKRPRVSEKPRRFIAVSVVDAVPATGPACRVRHPSGWMIECGSWPDPSWIKELVGERT
jgi:hypothetical protein